MVNRRLGREPVRRLCACKTRKTARGADTRQKGSLDSIDRVYDAGKAMRRLGFVCRTGFREILDQLEGEGRTFSPAVGSAAGSGAKTPTP